MPAIMLAIAGVQFLLDGVNFGAEDIAAPYAYHGIQKHVATEATA